MSNTATHTSARTLTAADSITFISFINQARRFTQDDRIDLRNELLDELAEFLDIDRNYVEMFTNISYQQVVAKPLVPALEDIMVIRQ